jgi:hypothetical protein
MITFIYYSSLGYHKDGFTSLAAGIADRIESKKDRNLIAIFDHNYGRAIYKCRDFKQHLRQLEQKFMRPC